MAFGSGPYAKIDMRSGEVDGYDAIFLSPHKFLGGPGSPGILVMNKSLYELRSSAPSTCGGGTVDYVNGYNEKACVSIQFSFQICRPSVASFTFLVSLTCCIYFWKLF